MASTLPKLRTDLDRRFQTEGDCAVLVIKDPLSRDFFRLKEAEGFIAEQLDGETPLDEVQRRVEGKFGASLAPEVLTGFVKTLDKNRLLERPGARSSARRKQENKRVAGNWLNLRFKLLDPEGILNRLLPWVRFCFTSQFVFVSAAIILLAFGITAFNFGEILGAAAGLYSFSTVPLLIATIFVVVTLHEFAHGLTCKYFGGEVREMGFLLIYLQPAFYCNVSDAWFFPKSQRLWVSFAGPYFELFIWALATLAWRVTDTDGWINHVALVVMATSGIKTFFNFNPLIKLDGYYLLSDYLGVPNLRKRSFRYVGAWLKNLGGVLGKLSAAAPRERRIYLTYGIPAAIASIAILTYFAWAFGEYLIMADQRLAFFAFAGLIGMRFRSKVRGLFGRNREPRESSRHSKDDDDGRRKSRRGRKWIIAAAVLVLMIVVPLELKVAGSINVLPIHNADVRAEIDGMISEVLVDEGQHVNAGDPIARIVDRDLRAELEKTEGLAGESRARLRLLEAGSRPEEIEVAMTTVARHEEQLRYHRGRLDRFKALNEQQLTSMLDYEESARLVASAESDLAEAKKKLDLLLAGTRPEEIEALRGTVASQESQIRHLQEQLRLTQVTSAAAGVVTTPSRQLKAMRLQAVAKGDLIAKVQDSKTITAEIAVSEKEIADVRTGQTVTLKVRAFPERVFPGKVTEIATTAGGGGASAPATSAPKSGLLPDATGDAGKSANTILVTTEIDNADGLLKPGMTGMAKIYCGKRQIITLMMRRLSRTFRVEFWSWW